MVWVSQGKARQAWRCMFGVTRLDLAGHGRRGMFGFGRAGFGGLWQGQLRCGRHGRARHGLVDPG